MESGQSSLIASYADMMNTHPTPWDLDGDYCWLNHAIFNIDASRVMVLFRHSDAFDNDLVPWKTHMMTMRLDGSDLICSVNYLLWRKGGITHQIWGRTPREVLLDADWCDSGTDYVVIDETHQPMRATRISRGLGVHGHLVFDPHNQYMAADTYADGENMQRLALVRCGTGDCEEIGRFRHMPVTVRDLRCDLHPRWSPDGQWLTVDSTHSGERKIYMLSVPEAMKYLDWT